MTILEGYLAGLFMGSFAMYLLYSTKDRKKSIEKNINKK